MDNDPSDAGKDASRAVHDAERAVQRIEIYKMMVEMADRVSQRRQAANSFYLTVNTFLVGANAYLSTLHPAWFSCLVISSSGVMICVVWIWNILSYKTLNAAKFKVIHILEESLAFQPFTDEWVALKEPGFAGRHRPFHQVEIIVPWIFGGIHTMVGLVGVPWLSFLATACL